MIPPETLLAVECLRREKSGLYPIHTTDHRGRAAAGVGWGVGLVGFHMIFVGLCIHKNVQAGN